MSEETPEWEDTDRGAIVKVISEGQFLVDKGFSVGREFMMADADYLNALEAYKRWAEEVAKPALEACTKGMMPIGPAYEAMQALAAYPQPV